MEIKETIGIDVSKKTLDVHIQKANEHRIFENSPVGIKKMAEWAEQSGVSDKDGTLFVFEHTGIYSHQLSVVLSVKDYNFVVVPGLEIKRSLGISRGKHDRADAARIALYAYRLRDELKPCRMPAKEIQLLKRNLSIRGRMVIQRAGYKASLKEGKRVLDQEDNAVLFEVQQTAIDSLGESIKKLDLEMDRIVKQSEEFKKLFKLITSVKGVGRQTALFLIAYTEGFTKFDTWRKFSSYCGTAPFENSSGTSIKGKKQVSQLANKRLKSLLDLCSKSALQHNQEIKQYYQRRIEQGKDKMSTINVIRNKIIARVFAVVKRGEPYVDIYKYAS